MRDVFLLARLEARRAAPLGLVALLGLGTWLAARGDTGDVEPVFAGLAGLDLGRAAARGAARASAQALGLAVAVLALVVHASGLAWRWRRGDGDWLGARPITVTRALVASTSGLALGGAALVAAVFAAAACSGATAGRALAWTGGPEEHNAVAMGKTLRVSFPAVLRPAGGTLRVRVQNTVLDVPYGDARLDVLGSDEALIASSTARVARRGFIEAALPEAGDTGPLVVQLTSLGPGTLAVVGPQPVEVFGRTLAPWRADLALGLHALAAALAAAALGVGFGAWVAAPLAALCVLALGVTVLALGPASSQAWASVVASWCPGAGLGDAFARASEGLAPGFPPAKHLLGLGGVTGVSLSLARLGLTSWRHAS